GVLSPRARHLPPGAAHAGSQRSAIEQSVLTVPRLALTALKRRFLRIPGTRAFSRAAATRRRSVAAAALVPIHWTSWRPPVDRSRRADCRAPAWDPAVLRGIASGLARFERTAGAAECQCRVARHARYRRPDRTAARIREDRVPGDPRLLPPV